MHTVVVISVGVALLAAFLTVGRLIGGSPAAMATAAIVFLPLWLIGAAFNFWMGVSKVGYSVKEEAPIFILVFAVPAIVALATWWNFRGAAR
jgi:hypothetical protein